MEDTLPHNRKSNMWIEKEQQERTLTGLLVPRWVCHPLFGHGPCTEHKGNNPQTKTHLGFIIKKDTLMIVKLVCVDMFKMCGLVWLIV